MLVELAKDSLMNALQHVIKAVAASSPIPILAGIRIQAHATGITFIASNTSMTIQVKLPQDGTSVKVQRSGAVVMPARTLYDVIRKLNDDSLVLEMKEPFMLTVLSGHAHIRLCGMNPSEFPSAICGEQHYANKLQVNNALFRSAIRQVAIAASNSELRPVLTGVSFIFSKNSLNLIATDGVLLASRTLHIERNTNDSFNVIIPAKHLNEVSKMLSHEDETTEITVSNNRVKFIANGLVIESALIEGTFPSVKKVIPPSFLCEIVVDKAYLLTAVECATVLAGGNVIRLEADANKLKLWSKTAEIGAIENEVPLIKISGAAFIVSLNGKFLSDILRNMDCAKIRIRYTGNNKPVVMFPDDSPNSALFLITPVITNH
ncbi:DNA polymerase III subunit beta [Paenibacillus sp. KS-LC4]|uniref:DNA polymerase III subunit beta n=1 Tax=Paenibacillus sp. KS-LC4 TaxID=2979727 RepID=UPI0030CBDFCF